MNGKISRRGFVKKAAAASALGCASGGLRVGELAAEEPASAENAYRSQWHRTPDRYWTGPATWANPWEDWQIQQGKLVCINARIPGRTVRRTVHCLTHQLNGEAAPAEIAVTVEYCGAKAEETGKGLVEQIGKTRGKAAGSTGFELGIRVKDPIDDYRSRLLFGSGMHVGITGGGELLIGRRARVKSPTLADALAAGKPVRLVCRLRPEAGAGTFRVELTAFEPTPDASQASPAVVHGTVEQSGVAAQQLVGNVALVGNLPKNVVDTDRAGLFAFSDWTIAGPKVTASPDQAFGPVLWTLYTLSDRVLKLTAQMPPLGDDDSRTVELQTESAGGWRTAATATIDPLSHTATFRVPDWDDTRQTAYRVAWTQKRTDGSSQEHTYSGTIRSDPKEKPEIVVAGYCCFIDYLFPNAAIVDQTAKVDPDVMFFLGDQIYEGVGGFGILRQGDLERMTVNYLRKLALLGWSFRELTRDRPTVWIPDDHDVYHGNVWGAGGRKITLEEWNSKTDYQGAQCVGAKGGYVQPAEFVKAVERTQTAHLPDPFDPTPVDQGIGVYYTSMSYGRVSFAILEDRKFKSGPLAVFKHKSHRPDWITDRAAARASDVPGAVLLGQRQLDFLGHWIADWGNVDVKMAVSQTIFCNGATHHGGADHFLVADMDSNGWPQSGRKAALGLLRRAGALMLAGDQHLPTIIQHGIDEHHDAGFSFCVPAGATGYQRWWRPEEVEHMTREGDRHNGRANTGKYADGFGNLIDVHAVANPPIRRTSKTRLEMGQQKSAGFGVVRVNKARGTLTLEAWPVGIDPTKRGANEEQYPGWPMTIGVADCSGAGNPTLPPVVLQAWKQKALPVVEVRDAQGELVSMVRMTGPHCLPRIFDPSGQYTVRIIVPEAGAEDRVLKTFEAVRPGQPGELVARFDG
jgi:hypothetical protein